MLGLIKPGISQLLFGQATVLVEFSKVRIHAWMRSELTALMRPELTAITMHMELVIIVWLRLALLVIRRRWSVELTRWTIVRSGVTGMFWSLLLLLRSGWLWTTVVLLLVLILSASEGVLRGTSFGCVLLRCCFA